jgi:apolipoprotein N-acyltransferase
MISQTLTFQARLLIFAVSWVIVALGQPAWSSVASLLASLIGYALFFRIIMDYPYAKKRFLIGTVWFSGVQIFQLSWSLSHPFLYIIAPYLLYSVMMGMQFGVIAVLANPRKMDRLSRVIVIASLWTLLEWSRLFFLSGFALNPIGLALASNHYTLQLTSLIGVYGLSFFVLLTNLLALRVWITGSLRSPFITWVIVATLPYAYGSWQINRHDRLIAESPKLNTLLVQPAFPVEESICFETHADFLRHVIDEWKHIFTLLAPHQKEVVELIALPEFVVPYGTYTFVYPYEEFKSFIERIFGDSVTDRLPPLESPFAVWDEGILKVSNAYLSQSIANLFNCPVVVGLEDAEDIEGKRHHYSSAMLFKPLNDQPYQHRRYAKRILVPMGEYIPFSFCRDLAANYGVFGSFTPGDSAVVWDSGNLNFGVSICYEELFGEIMRENRLLGADMLLNITSDAWFPQSKLIRQHLEHARLRTVENGIPLVRACNTGVTGCIDSLGRDVELLGKQDEDREEISEALLARVPMYQYPTLYSRFGDGLIIGISLLIVLFFLRLR